ncbi:MAG: potassium channel family protein [Methanolobus sp.]|nr:potassium channel family protein [Methanolobus sp.]
MTIQDGKSNEKSLGYEIFIGTLAIISVFDMFILFMPNISPNTEQVLTIIQGFLTIFFLIDFFYRFFTTSSKRYYFFRDFGWADLLSCWPGSGLRILRLFRLAKVYRLLKNYSYRQIVNEVTENRAQMAIYIVIVMVVIILQTGSNWVLRFESQSPEANIKTGSDALWWAFVTITTVGYGDKYPTTGGGRLIGIALMTSGVGVFSVFTGFIANSFLAPRKKKEEKEEKENISEASDPKSKILKIKTMLQEHEKASTELREKLEEIEKVLWGR